MIPNDAGIKATDDYIKGINRNDPNAISEINEFLIKEGVTRKVRTSYIRTFRLDTENSTQDLNSPDFQNISQQILDDYLTGRGDIQEVGEAHNLSARAIRELQALDGSTKTQVSTYQQQMFSAASTLNRTLDAGVMQTFKNVSSNAVIYSPRFTSLPDGPEKTRMLFQGIKTKYSEKVPTIMALLKARERFRSDVLAEAKLAVSEDRSPNTMAIVNGFQEDTFKLIDKLETSDEKQVKKLVEETELKKKEKIKKVTPTTLENEEEGNSWLESISDVVFNAIQSKEKEPQTFREKSKESEIGGLPAKEDPEAYGPKARAAVSKAADTIGKTYDTTIETIGSALNPPQQTSTDTLGSSTILSPAGRAKKLKRNPEGRRGSQAWIDEHKKEGKIDQEAAIDEVVSLSSDVATESKVWGFFKDLIGDFIGNKSMINDEPIPFSQRTKESSKEEPLILGKPTGRVTTEGRLEYENNKGGTSTEITIGVKNPKINNGELTHIPSIYNGKPVDQKEAERIIIANDGKDPETNRVITSGGNPEERSKSISFKKEQSNEDSSNNSGTNIGEVSTVPADLKSLTQSAAKEFNIPEKDLAIIFKLESSGGKQLINIPKKRLHLGLIFIDASPGL